MNKLELELNKKNIDRWLSTNDCFATVYSMHTHDEFWCSSYYAELKTHLGGDDLQKVIQLWKLYVIQQVRDGDLSSIPPMSEAEWIEDQYTYFMGRFDPKPYNESHKERVIEILEETRKSIQEKSGNFVKTLGAPGVYSNGKSTNLKKLDYIQSLLLSCSDGFVIDDEWNEFMVFTKEKNKFYLFSWETGA